MLRGKTPLDPPYLPPSRYGGLSQPQRAKEKRKKLTLVFFFLFSRPDVRTAAAHHQFGKRHLSDGIATVCVCKRLCNSSVTPGLSVTFHGHIISLSLFILPLLHLLWFLSQYLILSFITLLSKKGYKFVCVYKREINLKCRFSPHIKVKMKMWKSVCLCNRGGGVLLSCKNNAQSGLQRQQPCSPSQLNKLWQSTMDH